jgi:hypothetical protein
MVYEKKICDIILDECLRDEKLTEKVCEVFNEFFMHMHDVSLNELECDE